MSANAFCLADAPAWLTEDPVHQIPRLLQHLLEVADALPELYTELPWLAQLSVLTLLLERRDTTLSGGGDSGRLEAIITEFFAAVSRPVAKLIEALYTSPLLRERHVVGEILRRMAHAAGKPPLAREVVNGVCGNFVQRRVERLRSAPLRTQHAICRISWQQTGVNVRGPAGIKPAFVVLVTETATKKVLAFRCTTEPPSEMEVQLALYDALVFPGSGGMYLRRSLAPPQRLLVEAPMPAGIRRAAEAWGSSAREIPHTESAFLRGLERELGWRTLDRVQLLRILDRACERNYGYAPFEAKRRAMRQMGWNALADGDPMWCCLGLRELLASLSAVVGADGTVEWQGWRYRDYEWDVLRYFAQEAVTIRPSPLSEALVAVYWQGSILCCAIADELRHKDGTYRPFWFPYPRLGE